MAFRYRTRYLLEKSNSKIRKKKNKIKKDKKSIEKLKNK